MTTNDLGRPYRVFMEFWLGLAILAVAVGWIMVVPPADTLSSTLPRALLAWPGLALAIHGIVRVVTQPRH